MTLNQLRYFRVLADTEHYTKAADVLNTAQPSLSRAIALLEEELGVLLFTRRGRNVVQNQTENVPFCRQKHPRERAVQIFMESILQKRRCAL